MKLNKKDIGVGTGKKLAAIRKDLNITPQQMAARLNVKVGTYYKNENGETRPSWMSIYILMNDYNISVDWLMFNKGPKYLDEKVPNMTQLKEERTKEKQLLEQTLKQLNETKEAAKHFLALKKIITDIPPLMEAMIDDPELRLDILLKYHRHKKSKEN